MHLTLTEFVTEFVTFAFEDNRLSIQMPYLPELNELILEIQHLALQHFDRVKLSNSLWLQITLSEDSLLKTVSNPKS